MGQVSPLHAVDGSLDPDVNTVGLALIKKGYVRPDDILYAQMLSSTVRNCVDTLVLNRNCDALMGRRVNEPWQHHWHPSGGGQLNGSSYGETAALHLKRDLGLVVEPSRFQFVNSASFPWSKSAQGVPCHMNGVLMAVTLSEAELAQRSTPSKGDFAQTRFVPLFEVTEENGFHPAICLGARITLRNLQRYGRLGTIDPDLL